MHGQQNVKLSSIRYYNNKLNHVVFCWLYTRFQLAEPLVLGITRATSKCYVILVSWFYYKIARFNSQLSFGHYKEQTL
jgi:hypothetical protein